MKNLRTYIKFLLRNKLYTFVSVAGFSVSLMFVILLCVYVKQELSVDNFHEKKERIYTMKNNDGITFANYMADYVKDKCPEVESVTRVTQATLEIIDENKVKKNHVVMFADSTFFNIFSFDLLEGNPSQVLTARKSAVISQQFADKQYGGSNAMGRALTIDGENYTVTGILKQFPRNSIFNSPDIIIDYQSATKYWGANTLTEINNFSFNIFFLEKEGTDLTAKAPMLLDDFMKSVWVYKDGYMSGLEFIKLEEIYFQTIDYGFLELKHNNKTQLYIYTAIALLILIIATLNYINMTVAQSGFRGKESAIKNLLGCTRKTIILQILSESLLMTTCTFIIGLALAFLVAPFFGNALSTQLIISDQFTLLTVAGAIFFITMLSLISGLIPALLISSFSPIEIVKGTLKRKINSNYSKILIVFQYTVSIALLICSFMIKDQSKYLINHDIGFNKERIYVLDNRVLPEKQEGLRSKLKTIAGVEHISFSCGTPIDGGNNWTIENGEQRISFQTFDVDEEFLAIYGMHVTPLGMENAEDGVWINEKGYKMLDVNPSDYTAPFGNSPIQLAGIVSTFNFRTLHQEMEPMIMRKLSDKYRAWTISIKIADNADLKSTVESIDKAYFDYNGGMDTKSRFVDSQIQSWYEKELKTSSIMSAFTILTIVITVMGVFAMSLYLVQQKRKEIGIRKVNGATEKQILIMLNADSLTRVLIGFVIATPIAYYAITRWLENFAYKIDINPITFILAGIAIALLTAISMSYMTWQAAKENPVDSVNSK